LVGFSTKPQVFTLLEMPAIGITGGISTGKTTFCECLREILPGARFFDADQAAHQLVDRDPKVRKELSREFGAGIFSGEGDLNREKVRAIIFQDGAKRSALEQILHPRIRRQWTAEAETHRQSPDFFFADIPLLYETNGETLCDRVVVVACSPKMQLASLLRRGLGFQPMSHRHDADATAEAQRMINSQMPLDVKIKRADHVVWNNADRSVLAKQASALVDFWRGEKWTKA
jgi:dephospho-CoA kinase